MISRRYILGMVLALLVSTGIPLQAGDSSAFQPDKVFDQAHAAYVTGDYEAASTFYREMIDHGYGTIETWYNLANASFHSGKLGEAMLAYRRAWLLNPRDADVRANMALAAQRTGAIIPDIRLVDRIGQEFTRSEWKAAMVAGYWIAIAALLLSTMIPTLRAITKPVAIAGMVAGAVGSAGWSYWFTFERRPEAVVVGPGEQTALYEPRSTATPYFALPEGSIIRIEDTFDSWLKVSSAGKSGWMPKSAAIRVYPWHTAEIK